MNRIIYDEKCCGCSACASICPKNAISMQEDEYGYIYPYIDQNECINCGKCKSVCQLVCDIPASEPICTMAGVNKHRDICMTSSSGGIIPEIARCILGKGGIVIGAILDREKYFVCSHKVIQNNNELFKIQGSKYIQSDISGVLSIAKKQLDLGKKVLFIGTPCQVAAVKLYVKDHRNLVTIDLLCHGVPNLKMFNDYMAFYEKKNRMTIKKYVFRDKSAGYGYNSRIYYDYKGKQKCRLITAKLSSYIMFFLQGFLSRDSCYHCSYCKKERVGDITVGDYWGIDNEITRQLGVTEKDGVSCILVNTKKGSLILQQCDQLVTVPTKYDDISKMNQPLREACKQPDNKKELMDVYQKNGWDGIEQKYLEKYGFVKVLRWKLGELFLNLHVNRNL